MSKFRVILDGDMQDEVYDTYEEAEEGALYMCSCARQGAEILNMSNPGDYEFDEDTYEDPDYQIIEVDG